MLIASCLYEFHRLLRDNILAYDKFTRSKLQEVYTANPKTCWLNFNLYHAIIIFYSAQFRCNRCVISYYQQLLYLSNAHIASAGSLLNNSYLNYN